MWGAFSLCGKNMKMISNIPSLSQYPHEKLNKQNEKRDCKTSDNSQSISSKKGNGKEQLAG